MIYGNGMLANAFSKYNGTNPNICIFASGVSDSSCNDENEFMRERLLLEESIKENARADFFVYFSTCSIGDQSSLGTLYVKHKLEMESIVLEHSKSIIFRLPQVVGPGGNPKTFIKFLYHSIKEGRKFELWENATRNIIDVDDVVEIVKHYIGNAPITKNIVNVANPINYSVIEVVKLLENFLHKKAIYRGLSKGSKYTIDISQISTIIEKNNISFEDDYLLKVLNKYYS